MVLLSRGPAALASNCSVRFLKERGRTPWPLELSRSGGAVRVIWEGFQIRSFETRKEGGAHTAEGKLFAWWSHDGLRDATEGAGADGCCVFGGPKEISHAFNVS